jgi:ABC-type multidrug transport system ATPase subunit
LSGPRTKARIEHLAARLDASVLLDRPVRTLSTGEKARVVLARTLLHEPSVVLLDELTRSLDPGAAKRIRRHIQSEVAALGAAVVFASHDLEEVRALASQVLLLADGRVAALGPYDAVLPKAEEIFAATEAKE